MLSSERGSVNMVKQLLNAKADCNLKNNEGFTPLILSCDMNNYQQETDILCMEQLLKCKSDVNHLSDKGRTALVYAATRGSDDMVRMLLACGAKCDVKKQKASAT